MPRRRAGEHLQAQFITFLRSKQTVGLRTSFPTIPTSTSPPSQSAPVQLSLRFLSASAQLLLLTGFQGRGVVRGLETRSALPGGGGSTAPSQLSICPVDRLLLRSQEKEALPQTQPQSTSA